MDFLEDFNYHFKIKHGEETYNEICEQIKKENSEKYDSKYVTYIFKIAFLVFVGLDNQQIWRFFKDRKQLVDIEETRIIHKKSINKLLKQFNAARKESLASLGL